MCVWRARPNGGAGAVRARVKINAGGGGGHGVYATGDEKYLRVYVSRALR